MHAQRRNTKKLLNISLMFFLLLDVINMTTIEYLNLPVTNSYKNNFFDSDEDDSDEGYYYSDYDSDEFAYGVTRRTLKPHHNWKSYRLYRSVIHRSRRTWIMIVRSVFPSYRYRRLKNSNRCCTTLCCSVSSKKPHLLPTLSETKGRNYKRLRTENVTYDNVTMPEFSATRTIRPIITLDGEEAGPAYDDNMGLDFSVLEESESDDDAILKSKNVTTSRSSKAAQLLDLTEQEAMAHMQQAQSLSLDIQKEENAS